MLHTNADSMRMLQYKKAEKEPLTRPNPYKLQIQYITPTKTIQEREGIEMMDIPRQTRRESYEAMDKETRKRKILAVLDGREMTAREIAKKLGFHERNAAAPRLTELRKAGRVEPCGIRIDGTTGRPVTVWRKTK